MASMNIFKNSAFSVMSLTGAIDKMEYQPQTLGNMGLFEPIPTRTRTIFVDRRDGKLALIPTSADGAPPEDLDDDNRDAVPLKTTRLTKRFTLYAHELEGIRAFGSETELQAVQAEYLRRAARIRTDMELTHEYHRLGALQGLLLDADGTSVIYNYFDQFGVTQPSVINFELDTETTNVRGKLKDMVRSMARGSGGAFTPNTTVHALAGDEFYDKLINHKTVRETFLNWSAAADLRRNSGQGGAFQSFTFGDVTFHNYRGTDDNSTVAIPSNQAKFFPVGARDIFKVAWAPLETLDFVGTPGRETYMMNVPDRDRNMWTKGEIYSYPLYFCQDPTVLRSGVAA